MSNISESDLMKDNLEIGRNKVQLFNSDEFGQVRAVMNDDGSISINAEDTAVGFGWYQIKNNKKYPKWERINAFIDELGFSPQVGKDDYIPESLFYLLGMKAKNDVAMDFQKWLAVSVLPELRKNGSYEMNSISPELRAIFSIDKRTVEMSSRVVKLENAMTIDYSQQEELRVAVVKKVISALGGKDAPAYKELGKKAFCSIWRDYKRKLNVNSYRNTAVRNFELAKKTIESWSPDRELTLMIKGANTGI